MVGINRILLILTGGTIGSFINSNNTIEPSKEPLILSICKDEISHINFDIIEPFTLLSENITLKDREILIKTILHTDLSNYDGVIVTHGSDTLTYTASLVGMALRHIKIPIVFVAADLVLNDKNSNGKNNFLSAIDFIYDKKIKQGTFICYKDKNNENSVYLSTRLCEAEPFFDTFHPFDSARLGYTLNGNFIYEENRYNPTIEEINSEKECILPKVFSLDNTVSMLHSSPVFDYLRYDTVGLSAVLNYGYHSATVNEYCFHKFIRNCRSTNTDIYLASFKDKESPIYDSLSKIVKYQNVHRMYNISPESAVSKLIFAYSIDKSLINKNLFYEEIPR